VCAYAVQTAHVNPCTCAPHEELCRQSFLSAVELVLKHLHLSALLFLRFFPLTDPILCGHTLLNEYEFFVLPLFLPPLVVINSFDRLLHENFLTHCHGNAAGCVSNLSLHRYRKAATSMFVPAFLSQGSVIHLFSPTLDIIHEKSEKINR